MRSIHGTLSHEPRRRTTSLLTWLVLVWAASASWAGTPLDDARAARAEGRLAAAEELYRTALAEPPADPGVYRELAEVVEARGRPAEAGALLLELGRVLGRARRFGEAAGVLEDAARLLPGEPAPLALLGRALAEERRFEAAREVLLRAVGLGEDGLSPLLALAATHWETGRYGEAEALYRRILERYGESGPALSHFGQLLLFLGRFHEARAVLERAARVLAESPPLLFFLGRARAGDGDEVGARAAFERLLELHPDHQEARYLLGRLGLQAPPSDAAPAPAAGSVVLTAVARAAGVDFLHDPGRTPERHLPETMGSGLAFFDYDGDGWVDLYLVQSAGQNRLFRNLGDGTFEEAAGSGSGDLGYGQGVLAADLDGDGWVDLYLANDGGDVFLRNRGDGTFADATAGAGLGAPGWSSTAVAADPDRDGDLDLYVVRYLRYDRATAPACTTAGRVRREDAEPYDYCNVLLFEGLSDVLYRQEAPGSFRQADLPPNADRGLGAVWTDLDGDGLPDVYVANDLDANRLWKSVGASFEDAGLASGAALNEAGEAEAGMGVVAGDVDGDGRADLAVTHFDLETNTLYRNLGSLQFQDVSAASGFGLPSYGLLGFGIVLEDLDGDGDLDAYVADGHVFERPRRDTVDHEERDLVLLGDGGGRFREAAGVLDALPLRVGRGVASADYDGDGDADLGVQANGGAFELLRNDRPAAPWLGVVLHGRPPNTGAVGARLELWTGDGRRQVRSVVAGSGYQSTSDVRVLFAWPDSESPRRLDVFWPSGEVQRLRPPPSGGFVNLRQP